MTSKRVAISAVNWAELYSKCPKHQLEQFRELKTKTDNLVSKITSLPGSPPAINWNHYAHVVPVPGLVDKFKKQYESLSVEYPKDTSDAVTKVQSQGKVMIANAKRHADACLKMKASAEKMKVALNKLPPADEVVPEIAVAYFGMESDRFIDPRRPISLGNTSILKKSAPKVHWDFN
uniref:ATP synthase subunit d, mitochondrial n=1 Tax=Schistosoma japonicum TaxID=6182 RepID=C1LNU1_SCHJA|nr:ATP synthase, subunit d [Schistosoma japonicum]